MQTGYLRTRHLALTVVAALLAACGGGGGGSTPPPTYSISGSVVAAAGSVADSDTNDPVAGYTSNDTLQTAQEIPNPASIGGYVNQPGTGNPGRSQTGGDASDLYRVALAAGQQLTLSIANATASNDLDLLLGDENGNLLDASQGTGSTETLIISTDGTYVVEVYAFNGASNYVLAVGQGAFVPASRLSVLDDFVPGEVIARFDPSTTIQPGASTAITTFAGQVDLAVRAGEPGREMLMDLATTAQTVTAAPAARGRQESVLLGKAHIDPARLATIEAIKALRRRADIQVAEPNRVYHAQLTPNDSYYPLQWHYPLINLPQAWDITTGDTGVVVAVIDTGVILAHPDLQGQLVAGYDFISDPALALDGDGIDNNPDDPGDPGNPGTAIFHGTHVSGTIGAATNNSTGVAGINWAVSLMPLRVLSELGGTGYDVMQAVRYAAGLPNDSNTVPAKIADVINLSLGCTDPCTCSPSTLEQNVYTQARNQGVIIVAAAGNNNSACPSYPAAYDGVVSVSAVDINRTRAPYSNFGATVDVAAPGGDTLQDVNGDGYGDGVLSTAGSDGQGSVQPNYSFYQGTSMAAPHVAGVVALMRAVNPGLTPAAFDNLLATGQLTDDIGAPGRDDLYGYGLIDAYMATVAAGGTPAGPTLVATPAALNFGLVGTTLTLSLGNGGGGVLTIDPPADDAGWLQVSASSVDANGNGLYHVLIDRNGLAPGTYSATISVTSSANSVSVPVVMQVSNIAVPADAGLQYILLLDATSGSTISKISSTATGGRYDYRFSNVVAGTYQVVAGSDHNHDGSFCDVGESCGAYLTASSPATIDVNADLVLDDFTTSLLTGFSGLSTGSITIQPREKLDHTLLRVH